MAEGYFAGTNNPILSSTRLSECTKMLRTNTCDRLFKAGMDTSISYFAQRWGRLENKLWICFRIHMLRCDMKLWNKEPKEKLTVSSSCCDMNMGPLTFQCTQVFMCSTIRCNASLLICQLNVWQYVLGVYVSREGGLILVLGSFRVYAYLIRWITYFMDVWCMCFCFLGLRCL